MLSLAAQPSGCGELRQVASFMPWLLVAALTSSRRVAVLEHGTRVEANRCRPQCERIDRRIAHSQIAGRASPPVSRDAVTPHERGGKSSRREASRCRPGCDRLEKLRASRCGRRVGADGRCECDARVRCRRLIASERAACARSDASSPGPSARFQEETAAWPPDAVSDELVHAVEPGRAGCLRMRSIHSRLPEDHAGTAKPPMSLSPEQVMTSAPARDALARSTGSGGNGNEGAGPQVVHDRDAVLPGPTRRALR